jgi:glucokinase
LSIVKEGCCLVGVAVGGDGDDQALDGFVKVKGRENERLKRGNDRVGRVSSRRLMGGKDLSCVYESCVASDFCSYQTKRETKSETSLRIKGKRGMQGDDDESKR